VYTGEDSALLSLYNYGGEENPIRVKDIFALFGLDDIVYFATVASDDDGVVYVYTNSKSLTVTFM